MRISIRVYGYMDIPTILSYHYFLPPALSLPCHILQCSWHLLSILGILGSWFINILYDSLNLPLLWNMKTRNKKKWKYFVVMRYEFLNGKSIGYWLSIKSGMKLHGFKCQPNKCLAVWFSEIDDPISSLVSSPVKWEIF